MDVSVFLAKFLGLYFIIACGSVLVRRERILVTMEQWMENSALMMLGGMLATTFGLLILLFHNVWSLDWRILITLIGWISLAKGVSLFYFPAKMKEIARKMVECKGYMSSVVVFLFLGFFLLVMGLIN